MRGSAGRRSILILLNLSSLSCSELLSLEHLHLLLQLRIRLLVWQWPDAIHRCTVDTGSTSLSILAHGIGSRDCVQNLLLGRSHSRHGLSIGC